MVSSMFEVYVTTKVLQFALTLLSQSRLKDGNSYVLHRKWQSHIYYDRRTLRND